MIYINILLKAETTTIATVETTTVTTTTTTEGNDLNILLGTEVKFPKFKGT